MSDRPPVGSLAEEATRLLEALQSKLGHGSPDCRFCPVCQGLEAVRTMRPEAVEHLFTAAASVLAAVRAGLDKHDGSHRDETTVGPDGEQEDAPAPEPDPRPGLQHIEVR